MQSVPESEKLLKIYVDVISYRLKNSYIFIFFSKTIEHSSLADPVGLCVKCACLSGHSCFHNV